MQSRLMLLKQTGWQQCNTATRASNRRGTDYATDSRRGTYATWRWLHLAAYAKFDNGSQTACRRSARPRYCKTIDLPSPAPREHLRGLSPYFRDLRTLGS